MKHDRQRVIDLLTEAHMMPLVRELGRRFGPLTAVAIITPNDQAYVGHKPRRTQKVGFPTAKRR